MAWFVIAIAVVFTWVVSFCKVFYSLRSNVAIFSNGRSDKRRNVLLVIAHPDDESMFFSPTILFLTSEGHNVHILCFSAGDAEGKGGIRMEELYRACAILKVPLQQVKILDHPNLQDGFDQLWNHKLLAAITGEEIKIREIDTIITFDNYGVSGHPNHRDVHLGICTLLREKSQKNVEAWELISTSILRKYSGPVDIWLSILLTLWHLRGQAHCLLNSHPQKSFLAMAEHESQWVWFRKLFVLFSSYTYVNTLQKMCT